MQWAPSVQSAQGNHVEHANSHTNDMDTQGMQGAELSIVKSQCLMLIADASTACSTRGTCKGSGGSVPSSCCLLCLLTWSSLWWYKAGKTVFRPAPEAFTREPSCNAVLLSGTIMAVTNQACCATISSDKLISLACLSARLTWCRVQRHVMLLPPCAAAYCSLVILRSANNRGSV